MALFGRGVRRGEFEKEGFCAIRIAEGKERDCLAAWRTFALLHKSFVEARNVQAIDSERGGREGLRGLFGRLGEEKIQAFFRAAGAEQLDRGCLFAAVEWRGECEEIVFTRGVRFLCQCGMHGEACIFIEGWQRGEDGIFQLGVA